MYLNYFRVPGDHNVEESKLYLIPKKIKQTQKKQMFI